MKKLLTAFILTSFITHGEAMDMDEESQTQPKFHSITKEEIEEVGKAIADDEVYLTQFAYQMQCMGDSCLHTKEYEEAAKYYVLSLVAVFDNYDLKQFLLRKNVDIEILPDLSKKVFIDKNPHILDSFLEKTISNLK